jgi:hypothetical protein
MAELIASSLLFRDSTLKLVLAQAMQFDSLTVSIAASPFHP